MSRPGPQPHTTSNHALPWSTRAGLRLRHAIRLGRDVQRHGAEQRLWWLLPAVVLLVIFAIAITTTSAALPVAVYTLF